MSVKGYKADIHESPVSCFNQQLEQKPRGRNRRGRRRHSPGRKEGSYAWFEIQDSLQTGGHCAVNAVVWDTGDLTLTQRHAFGLA
jgi:hypothetical protein